MGKSRSLTIAAGTLEGLARAARIPSDFGGCGGSTLDDIFRVMTDMRSLVLFDQPDLSDVKERDLKKVLRNPPFGLKEQTRRRVPSMAQRIAECHRRRG
ncbi:MAG: hypothetical protein WC242_02245 [Candidatus Paceibacterota bacterium]|jgi:hypothetical protein